MGKYSTRLKIIDIHAYAQSNKRGTKMILTDKYRNGEFIFSITTTI